MSSVWASAARLKHKTAFRTLKSQALNTPPDTSDVMRLQASSAQSCVFKIRHLTSSRAAKRFDSANKEMVDLLWLRACEVAISQQGEADFDRKAVGLRSALMLRLCTAISLADTTQPNLSTLRLYRNSTLARINIALIRGTGEGCSHEDFKRYR
jgi:hypothetical protein